MNKYSGYAYTTWIDTNGLPYVDTTLQGLGASWYPHQSGICMRDVSYDFGGFCYFFLCGGGCDNTTGTFPASTGSDYIQPYTLTAAEYISNIVTPASDGTYTSGYEIEAALATATLESTGVDYFDVPICQEDGSTAGLYYCQQYQPATGLDADGSPRFNTLRLVEVMSITGFIDTSDANYDLFAGLVWPTNTVVWEGATSLMTAGVAVAIASASLAVL